MKTFDFGKWPKNRKKVKANPQRSPRLSLYAALIYLNTFYRFYAWVFGAERFSARSTFSCDVTHRSQSHTTSAFFLALVSERLDLAGISLC